MHTILRRTTALVAALVLATPAFGHSQTADSLPHDSVKTALVHQILAQTRAVDNAITVMENGIAAERQANPRIPGVFWDRFIDQVHARRGEFENLMIVVYERHFSADELRQLLAFYQTPVGRRFIAEQPAVMRESMAAGGDFGRRIGLMVSEQLKAEGVTVEPY